MASIFDTWASPCSEVAAYLTRKGASLDPLIQWGSPVFDEEDVRKRKLSSPDCASAKRPKIVHNFDAKTTKDAVGSTLKKDGTSLYSDQDFNPSSSPFDGDQIVPSIWSFIETHIAVSDHDFDIDDSETQRWMAAEVEEMQHVSARQNSHAMVPEEYMSSVSGSLSSITSKAPSMKLRTHTVPTATVLCIDIKGFTVGCAAMDAGRVGEWVAEFYERVDIAAAAHGVSKVEVRGDCCICIAGVEGTVPSPLFVDAAADRASDQATRTLNFAAALQADLASLTYIVDGAGAGEGRAMATATRMGVATGEIAVLISDADDAHDGAGGFVSVLGETVSMAAKMESLAESGAVLLHELAAERWVAEGAGRAAPPTVCLEVKGHGLQRAAVFDCAAGAFRPAVAAAIEPPLSPRRPAESGRMRRAASAPP
jgi:class 3 adenylate cyclase